MEKKENSLVAHYRKIDDLKADFRNSNLFFLVASLVQGKSVLDIGCGSGFFARMLQESGKKVVGIEPEQGMREIASRVNPGVIVLPGRAEDINVLITTKVDTVVMVDVLEHIGKDDVQVQKVRDILNDNGEFVIVVPSHPILFGERDRSMSHYRRYTKESLTKVLTENGFRIMSMRHWNALGFLPYLVSEKILRRPLRAEFRGSEKTGILSSIIRRSLFFWFRYVENNCNFYFGLSIIAVAKKV